jgi:hypothetical protein
MIEQLQWDKCMKSALMIYQDQITLLGGIPEKIESRNDIMRTMFEKITLTYFSYSIKETQNPLNKDLIIHNVIDFMIKTESFTYLFTTIFEACGNFQLTDIFIEQLEEYVENGSIKWTTEEVLKQIVEHY